MKSLQAALCTPSRPVSAKDPLVGGQLGKHLPERQKQAEKSPFQMHVITAVSKKTAAVEKYRFV